MTVLDQPTNMRCKLSEVSFLPLFSQEGEGKDMWSQILSWTEPCNPRTVLTHLGCSKLRCCDNELGLTSGDEVLENKHGPFAWEQHVAVCCFIWEESRVFILTPAMHAAFTPWLKFYIPSLYLFLSLKQNIHHCESKMYRKQHRL